jgi:hypothetical protein
MRVRSVLAEIRPTSLPGDRPFPKIASMSLPREDVRTIADDVLRGAEAIAAFIFGDRSKRRQVYHLAETSRLPTFKLGAMLCARRSTILRWIAEQEAKATEAGR